MTFYLYLARTNDIPQPEIILSTRPLNTKQKTGIWINSPRRDGYMPSFIYSRHGKLTYKIMCERDWYDGDQEMITTDEAIDGNYDRILFVPATLNKHAKEQLNLNIKQEKMLYTRINKNSNETKYEKNTTSKNQTTDHHITDLTKIGQFKLSCREYHKSSSIPSDTETLKSILTGQKNDKNHTRGAKNRIATTINQALHTSIAMRVFYRKEINAKEIKERLMDSLGLPNTIMEDEYNKVSSNQIGNLTSAKEAQTLYDELLTVDYFPEHRHRRYTNFINFFNQCVPENNYPRLTAFNKHILVDIFDKILRENFELDNDFMNSRLYQDLKSFMPGQAMKELDSRLLEHDHATIPSAPPGPSAAKNGNNQAPYSINNIPMADPVTPRCF